MMSLFFFDFFGTSLQFQSQRLIVVRCDWLPW